MIITQTPLRIGLVGGGTDIPSYYREHGGRVLNAAIDKYVYVIVKQRFDDDVYLNYSQKEIVSRVEDMRHDLVREAMHMAGIRKGVEITTLPTSRPLDQDSASSSAVTVGLLHALFAYQGIQVSAAELAERACTIELDRCGKPIGKQDQYAAAYGGICDMRFGPGDRVSVDQIRLDPRGIVSCRRADALLHRDHPQRRHHPQGAERQHQRPAAAAGPAARRWPARRPTACGVARRETVGVALARAGRPSAAGQRRSATPRSTTPSTPCSQRGPPARRSRARAAAASSWSCCPVEYQAAVREALPS